MVVARAAGAPQSVGDAAPALLTARGLACTVAGRELWRDVDIELHAGECLAVTGPSGTGKTLLLRALAGLRASDRGEIFCTGKPLADWWMPAFRAHVVYLAQRPALPDGSVRAALAAPFALRVHRGQRCDVERAIQHLAGLGLTSAFLEQATDDLSGGESQVAALVRALLIKPSVLLLDEPTAALDPERTRRVETLLQAWLTEAPLRACLWVSHDAAQVGRVSQRTLALGSP